MGTPSDLNKLNSYGFVAVGLHWLTAVVVIGLFALGLWMVDLTYYDPWYQTAPDVHRSVGILLAAVVAFRLVWRLLRDVPPALPTHAPWERRLARLSHWGLYLGLLAMFLSGYLISTATGQPIDVFGWFEVPALVVGVDNLEDTAGEVHEWLAYALMALAGLHTLSALKHHFWDRDETLRRMLKIRTEEIR